ncbi:aminotransferase class III-fold pyridoxal phosphate-dependent enzyme [Pseudomaricurvus alkylphenolicus]|uniref:aminotransferase class III-fold pyridoxal phosphate-dependent enzyme n=1 Tax=Pseudomaricurvus alkylphenolicus TaxID=1306991 RepID=UPI00141EB667|nr:aminotransferase class III-fold pyridoxal phosphate-dependent enzyme [Pseudomaricurvus alkylphenolicus]NIB40539.1 aminotransferase class III-fold pyridoxal phosphate-dependent enzyme [Pseudomaricurvus alkylphenolicus]
MSEPSQSLWHPMVHPNDMKSGGGLCIQSANGVFVTDDQGNEYLDGSAGLWCVNVGHNRQEIKDAITRQLDELEYVQLFGGIAHPRAVELAEKLTALTARENMKRVLFSSGGSDAIESALKLARQYHRLNGEAERSKFISLKQAYHGTHIGGTSINGSTMFRRNYEPLLPGCFQVATPWLYRNPWTQDPEELGRLCAQELEREIQFHGAETVAAFIAEPIQGIGGVIVPPDNYWPLVREICDKHGVLLITDEVITGFGRSGSMFGCRGWGVKPDIMCLAKGISSGYIPLGATLVNERIEQAFEANHNFDGNVMHGYTYSGHPVACAAGIAALDIVCEEKLPENAAEQGAYLMDLLKPMEERFTSVGEVRGKGLMIAIDLVEDKRTRVPVDPKNGLAKRLASAIRDQGALVRAAGDKIILSPPLVYQTEHSQELARALIAAFESIDR